MRNLKFYVALALSTLSGCLWFLAVTPFDLSALAWIAAIPMFMAIERAGSIRCALFLGWWAGLIETAGGTADQPTGRTLLLRPSLFEHAEHSVTCASFARFLRVDRKRVVPEYLFWYLQDRNGFPHEYRRSTQPFNGSRLNQVHIHEFRFSILKINLNLIRWKHR